MIKADIISVFENIADILQIRGDDPVKVKAYRNIAVTLSYVLPEDVQIDYVHNELAKVKGIGTTTIQRIDEIINTGQSKFYEELKSSIPSGVLDLMDIPGVGPSTTARLYQELHIDGLDSLQQALQEQKLRNIKGMGKKTEDKIREGLDALMRHRQVRLMGYVLPAVQSIVDYLIVSSLCFNASITGSLRRKTETIREAEILVVCSDTEKIRDALSNIEFVTKVNSDWTSSKGSVEIVGNVKLNIKFANPEYFGTSLICLTGSDAHVDGLNSQANLIGIDPIKLEFPPIWTKEKSEEEIYTVLKLPFIVPELREGIGEIQSALSGQLPELVDIKDIRGDLHVHSTWSDGHESIIAMAEFAKKLGYEYIAMCDHSVSSKIANGLSVERILNKMIEVRGINEKIDGIEILMGAEVDILKDGNLDYPDMVLEKLDVVIASIHSGFGIDESTMTKRIIKAIENKFVHIIGHPSGRLLGKRDEYQLNIDAIIDASAENNKSLEINAYPERLDLKDSNVRKAKERGVLITINTDAHSSSDYNFMKYGVYTARRGWLEKKDVLNTRSLASLIDWLRKNIS